MTTLTVGSYNFGSGGIDDGQDARLRRQLAMLAGTGADVWAFQECKYWRDHKWRAFFLAERVLGMRGFLAESGHYGCDVGVFIRESAGIRVTGIEHEEGAPWFHAVACVLTEVAGLPLNLASAHFSPESPVQRRIEAEALRLVMERGPLIVGGDWNAVPARDPDPDVTGVHPAMARRKLDRAAGAALDEAGLLDAAACMGVRDPTVGHARGGRLAYRCDGVRTTLPEHAVRGYRVIPEDTPGSDHLATVGAFSIPGPRKGEI